MPETVLGVDPGVSETGWAILRGGEAAEGASLLASGLIKTYPGPALSERLLFISRELAKVIQTHQPEAFAVEEMFFAKVANTIRNTLQARGVVLLAAAQAGLEVCEYNPRTVKLTLTGSGTAEKAQMQSVTQRALNLAERLTPDDVADAAAIALCHLRSRRFKKLQVLDSYGGKKRLDPA
jgi:crossover junction endodeoxyribonuclease RuvC